jgi:hypothetical protein
LLRLLPRLTPPSVSLTHTVKRPRAEAQRFHAIKTVCDSLGAFDLGRLVAALAAYDRLSDQDLLD